MIELVVALAIILIIYPILVGVFHFPSIGISDSTYNFITDGMQNVFATIHTFVPLNFMLACLSLIILSRYATVLWGVVDWIIRKVTGH